MTREKKTAPKGTKPAKKGKHKRAEEKNKNFSPVQSRYIKSKLQHDMTNYAVYVLSPGEKILYSSLTILLGGLAGLAFYGGLFKSDGEATRATAISNVIVFLLIGLVCTRIFLPVITRSLKKKRDEQLRKQFIDFLQILVSSLSAGATLMTAFENAGKDLGHQYKDSDFIVVEIREILEEVKNGYTLEEAIQDFGERSGNEDIANFSNVIGNCFRLGGDFNEVVRRTRNILCEKIAIEQEIETKLTGNKIELYVMSIAPIALVMMLKVSSTDFAKNLSSAKGVLASTAAIGIFIGSYLWGQKIINIR